MKHLDTVIRRYNTPETAVIVASYPGRGSRSIRDIDAVASYTDHLAGSLVTELTGRGRKLVVLAQKTGPEEEWYTENGILVGRVWDKGSPLSYASIIRALSQRLNRVRDVMVQFEFHQFGGNGTTATFPLFLALLRVSGRQVSLVMHQVVKDFGGLSGHLGVGNGSLKSKFLASALHWFYRTCAPLPQKLIVHNQIFAERLTGITGRRDISVIPHGLGAIRGRISRNRARKLLGYTDSDFVIMSFGFLTWYKGTDWLVRQAADGRLERRVKLLIAGGESPNLRDKQHYKAYVKGIYADAARTKRVKITGFVENRDIPMYFAAADLAVLPYRTLMSSSGPLAMTIAFNTPFIISDKLLPYTADRDFREAMTASGLLWKDIAFPLTTAGMNRALDVFRRKEQGFRSLSAALSRSRNWKVVAKRFADLLDGPALAHAGISAIMKKTWLTYALAGKSAE